LEYLNVPPARADLWFRLHGLFDAIFRLLIPVFVRFYPINIIYLFPACVFTGLLVLTITFGLLYTSLHALAILPIICKFSLDDLMKNLLVVFCSIWFYIGGCLSTSIYSFESNL
jgi:hypothetical protein